MESGTWSKLLATWAAPFLLLPSMLVVLQSASHRALELYVLIQDGSGYAIGVSFSIRNMSARVLLMR